MSQLLTSVHPPDIEVPTETDVVIIPCRAFLIQGLSKDRRYEQLSERKAPGRNSKNRTGSATCIA